MLGHGWLDAGLAGPHRKRQSEWSNSRLGWSDGTLYARSATNTSYAVHGGFDCPLSVSGLLLPSAKAYNDHVIALQCYPAVSSAAHPPVLRSRGP